MTSHKTRQVPWRVAVFTALLALLAGCGEPVPAVSVAQAQAQSAAGQAVLIDVREPHEYADVRAPGARLIPLGQLAQRLAELPQDKAMPVLLVCRSGSRSAAAVDMLGKAGYTQTLNVTGGMNAWQKAGLPVVRGTGNGS